MSVVMHVDMDAFYASVELRRRPELVNVPMWVGGQHRGVVLSASYPARSFGVRGGMAVSQARRLCPGGVGVTPDFSAYTEVSAGIEAILATVTPQVYLASIDEAYLDLTIADRAAPSAAELGQRLRAQVWDEQGITCSVGIGPNRLVAKMASVAAKPDGLVEVPPDRVVDFLHPLPVERLVGVGKSTASRLHGLGVSSIGELARAPRSLLQATFGRNAGALLVELAWGRDAARNWSRSGERGVGCQETFVADIDDPAQVRAEILRVSAKVAARMRVAGMLGRTVTVNLRFANFETCSGSVTLPAATDLTGEIYAAAVRLCSRLVPTRRVVRRVGVRVTGLVDRSSIWIQPALDDPEFGWRAAESAADKANLRFGPRSVQRAVLTGRGRGVSI